MPKKKRAKFLDRGETPESYKKDFIDYAHGYYGKGKIMDMGLTKKQVGQAYDDLMQNDKFFKDDPWREKIRMYWEKRGKMAKIFRKQGHKPEKFRR